MTIFSLYNGQNPLDIFSILENNLDTASLARFAPRMVQIIESTAQPLPSTQPTFFNVPRPILSRSITRHLHGSQATAECNHVISVIKETITNAQINQEKKKFLCIRLREASMYLKTLTPSQAKEEIINFLIQAETAYDHNNVIQTYQLAQEDMLTNTQTLPI